jgi:mevalonate kinase
MEIFSSQTKLMLTGEYLVLKGALSLSIPLKFSQKLSVCESAGTPSVIWNSMIDRNLWFQATLLLPDFRIQETDNIELANRLCQILRTATELNSKFLYQNLKYQVTSVMDFDPFLGIGSSSSLISNIAWWADCDPFKLNNAIFNGSGYDIACARSSAPIIYKIAENKPSYRQANFNPAFKDQIYFIYLNRKQNSRESVLKSDLTKISTADISAVSELTLQFEEADNLMALQQLMNQHEEIIAKIIHIEPIKSLLFNDLIGSIKSLGAWGGDFVMVASEAPEEYVRNYFTTKNYNIVYRYDEILLPDISITK